MSLPARFLVVEGLEGAGKSTAIETIKARLEELQISFIVTREPGGTRVGESLRELIKEQSETGNPVPLTELLIFYAARVQLLHEVIRPALKQGKWVIADRFELSTFAYQGGGRGIDYTVLNSLSSICLQGMKPDQIIFMDISPQEGLKRAQLRGKADRFEEESAEFFIKVNEAYHQLIREMDNVTIIDAAASRDIVKKNILKLLNVYTGAE